MSPLVLLVGLLIGLSLGALGGGGSILTVPALVYLFDQGTRQATTSSLLIVGATSLIALVPHARRGNVRFGQGLVFGGLGTAGAVLGSAISTHVRPAVLLSAFAILMLLVAAVMVRRSGRTPLDGQARAFDVQRMVAFRPFSCACRRVAEILATATLVGLLTGFFGVGGGFALVPALTLVLAFPMPVAVGTSLLVIAINSATALAARASSGTALDWGVIAAFTAAAVVGSLLGGQITARVAPHQLSRAFAVLLIAVAVYTAARSLPALA